MASEFQTDVEGSHDETGQIGALARRAPRISQADVLRAADELLVEGHRPTIDRVRMRLGRGSPNTINEHLDAWWTKLGSRLRDLPGREFPQLPERVSTALQRLWTEALEGAQEALRATLAEREHALAAAHTDLETDRMRLAEQARIDSGRAAALEESLALARSQLTEANRRAETLESALKERDESLVQLRARNQTLEQDRAGLTQKFEADRSAYDAERARLEERHERAHARWLVEVDRARQSAKESEKKLRDMERELARSREDRGRSNRDLAQARADLKSAGELQRQLERQLQSISKAFAAPGRARQKGQPAAAARPSRKKN